MSGILSRIITYRKQRTLRRLKQKHEERRIYPIASEDLLKVKKCPLCGSAKIVPITEVYLRSKLNFFTTSTCRDCLFTFRSISPNLAWFEKCWQQIYSSKLEVFNPREEKIRHRRYSDYHQKLSKYIYKGKMLDIGGGYGTGSNVFKQKGFQVNVVEPEVNKVNYIKNFYEIQVVSNSIEKFVLQKCNYDVIVFAHCLEHIDYPEFVMRRLKNLLNRETGFVYLELPILWNYGNWYDALYLPHKSNFTKENLARLVEQSGFKILERFDVYYHSPKEPWDWGLILKYIGASKRQIHTSLREIRNGRSIKDVRRVYRKDFPLKTHPAPLRTIKYSVPYIEQFFQILLLDTKKLIPPKTPSGFYNFVDSKKY